MNFEGGPGLRELAAALVLVAALASEARAHDVPHHHHDEGGVTELEEERPERSTLHEVILYVPNRVLDLLDVVRARVRIGPGIAVGVRATQVVDLFIGSYNSLYVGLPGPRGRRLPRSPIGVEDNHGVEVSIIDGATGFGFAPEYGPAEVGAGAQVALGGIDLGVEPWEAIDLIAGFFMIDLRDDDL
ncbi:MAG: hypothetical protein CL910_18990 [Deltaproteobacteria bacterium]|nr:hypothetical protein [Deltaproteobacteria bacterium]